MMFVMKQSLKFAYERLVLGWLVNGLVIFTTRFILAAFIIFG